MGRIRISRRVATALVAGAAAASAASMAVSAGPAVQSASAATGPVTCDGTQTQIQSGLHSVAGATLQDHTPVLSGGPNLVLNGDFTYAEDDTDANALDANFALSSAGPYPGTYKAIKHWPVTGGGSNSYGLWGGLIGIPDDGWGLGNAPAPALPSMVYMGNGPGARYHVNSGSVTFNSDGFSQSDFSPVPEGPEYGTTADPLKLSQTVTGLTVGHQYRLQFYRASEDSAVAVADTQFGQTGVAGIEITGYHRTYFLVPAHSNAYVTLDFVATNVSTTISFLNWGHILILGPPDTDNPGGVVDGVGISATELGLDDVILTECAAAEPVVPPEDPTTPRFTG